MEKDESTAKFPSRRAVLYVWVYMIVAMMAFNRARGEKLYQLMTGDQYLLIEPNNPDHTGHKEFEV